MRVRASNHGGRDDGLRIGVVAPPHRTGSAERFLREVVLGLASHASRPTVTLYTRHDDGTAQGDATHDGLLDLGGRVREVERDGIDAVLEADFDQLDVIWCTWPHFRSPPISRLPIVTTLHDLNWRSFWSLSPKQAEQLETEMPLWIAASTLFVSSSEFIRGQLCHEYGLVHSHTRVVPLTGMRPLEVSPEAVTAVRKRYCLPSRFFLFPAVRSPHKNFVGVERALELLRAEGKPMTVVATSEHTDWYHGPDLLGLGYVSNETLRALYELSEGVLMPTLYEAGSFPIFEAMLVGKPVACSSIPPIVEQIERDHAVAEFFNPLDPADIAAALKRLTSTSRRKRAAIVKHNREAVGRRGWADVAGGYLDVFAEAVALSVGAP